MNRNVESHFSTLPDIDIQRSIFDRSSGHMTSFNAGDLIPIYVDEVLPGDSIRMTSSKVIRAQTLLTPTFGNMYLDTYWYFVPMRLVWDHAKEFFGENTQSAWVSSVEYQIPSISAPTNGFATGTIADYMGLPVGVEWSNSDPQRPSALPFRGYGLICDQWYRDQNVSDPLNIPTGDSNQTGTNGSSYINDVANGGMPFKVAKYHDYFTSCLPSPQKGNPVTIPGSRLSGLAPVYATDDEHRDKVGLTHWSSPGQSYSPSGPHLLYADVLPTDITTAYGMVNSAKITQTGVTEQPIGINNLWADIDLSAGAISINELRLAFQLQKFYEKQARGGFKVYGLRVKKTEEKIWNAA